MSGDQTDTSQVGRVTIFCDAKCGFHIMGLNKTAPKSVSGYKSLAVCARPKKIKANKMNCHYNT